MQTIIYNNDGTKTKLIEQQPCQQCDELQELNDCQKSYIQQYQLEVKELQKKLDEALYDKEQIIKNCWTGAEVEQVFKQTMSLLFDKKTEGE